MNNETVTFKCQYCDEWYDVPSVDSFGWCEECRKLEEFKEYGRNNAMRLTRTKLVHFTDLDGKNRYFLNIKSGNMIRQQEINFIEYHDLKSAEEKHYVESINRYKQKYEL